jgi:hypothetical protein
MAATLLAHRGERGCIGGGGGGVGDEVTVELFFSLA